MCCNYNLSEIEAKPTQRMSKNIGAEDRRTRGEGTFLQPIDPTQNFERVVFRRVMLATQKFAEIFRGQFRA
jgi:hypothetical protein